MADLAQYVTTREAAAILGVSKSRVDQFVRDDRLGEPVTVGQTRLIPRASVVALSKKKRRTGRPKKEIAK